MTDLALLQAQAVQDAAAQAFKLGDREVHVDHVYAPIQATILIPDQAILEQDPPEGGWLKPGEAWKYDEGRSMKVFFTHVKGWKAWCSGIQVVSAHGMAPPPGTPTASKPEADPEMEAMRRELAELKELLKAQVAPAPQAAAEPETAAAEELPKYPAGSKDEWRRWFAKNHPDIKIPPAAKTAAWFEKKYDSLE